MGLFDWIFGTPGPDAFAKRMVDALRKAGETRPIRHLPKEFAIEIGKARELLLNLGNAYDEFRAAPRGRREGIIARFVAAARQAASAVEMPGRYEEARPRLRPRVRERSYLDARRFLLQAGEKRPPELGFRPLADHLIVTLVYDLPDSMMEVSDDQLKTWGVDLEQALADARENLWDASKERLRELAPGLWRSPWEDNYDATRLVLHDLVWQYKVRGEPVAVTPNRDTLLVTGSEDAAGLGKLFRLAEEALEKPRVMGGFPVVLREREWAPFVLPAGHPLHAAWNRLRVLSWAQEYAAQEQILVPWFERQGEDVYVATYTAMQKKETGEAASHCVWSEGVHALLPVADQVGFFRPDLPESQKVLGPFDWDRVREVCADLMARERLFPERYRVRKFPTPAQLEALVRPSSPGASGSGPGRP